MKTTPPPLAFALRAPIWLSHARLPQEQLQTSGAKRLTFQEISRTTVERAIKRWSHHIPILVLVALGCLPGTALGQLFGINYRYGSYNIAEYDPNTGRFLNSWKTVSSDNEPGPTLAASGNSLFVLTSQGIWTTTGTVNVSKYDVTTRNPINPTLSISSKINGAMIWLARMAVSGNTLFVLTDDTNGDDPTFITAYNATTGEPTGWSRQFSASETWVSDIAATGNLLFLSTYDPTTYAYSIDKYDLATGAIYYSFLMCGSTRPNAIAASGNSLYVETSSSAISKFDTASGHCLSTSYLPPSTYLQSIAVNHPTGNGFDISASFLANGPMIPRFDWHNIYDAGYDFCIVGTWGGGVGNNRRVIDPTTNTRIPFGQRLLEDARDESLSTGAYCLISWCKTYNNQPDYSGTYQVAQAIERAGTEKSHISFMAIDVESDSKTPLGTTTSSQRIARIADAIQAVRFAGLTPIIYSSDYQWNNVTGGTREISGIPIIWNTYFDGDPNLNGHFVKFEGVDSCRLKQYAQKEYLKNFDGTKLSLSVSQEVDLDSCASNAFPTPGGNSLPLPLIWFQSSQPSQAFQPSGGSIITVPSVTVKNGSQSSDAIATRIIQAQLLFSNSSGGFFTINALSPTPNTPPLILNTISAGGSSPITSTFAFSLPSPYHGQAFLKIFFTFGGASNDAGGSGYTRTQLIKIP